MDEQELINEFVNESRENLTLIEGDFLQIEAELENVAPEILNNAFRCVHSIKGSSSFFGLNNIKDVAHAMETLMDRLRKGDLQPTIDITGFLLVGLDHLVTMFEDISTSNDHDILQILSNLNQLVEDGQVSEEAPPEAAPTPKKKNAITEKAFQQQCDLYLELVQSLLQVLFDDGSTGANMLRDAQNSLGEMEEGATELELTAFAGLCQALSLLIDQLIETSSCPDEKDQADIIQALKLLGTKSTQTKDGDQTKTLASTEVILLMTQQNKNTEKAPAKEKSVSVSQKKEAQSPAAAVAAKNAPVTKAGTDDSKVTSVQEVETIRVKVPLLNHLMALAGEMVLVRNQQLQMSEQLSEFPMFKANVQKLDLVTSEIQECVMQTRMQPVGNLFSKFTRIVRDLGLKTGKKINLSISGKEVEVDRTILEALSDPLTHMIRNCCDHGLELPDVRTASGKSETGAIDLQAWHEGGYVNIEIRDDGKGIDPAVIKNKVIEKGIKTPEELENLTEKEILSFILLPGFSTATEVSDLSGRGVGMDVVRANIEKIGGNLELDSIVGQGTAVRLQLPLTLAIIPCLVVKEKGHSFAIPQVNLEELVTLYSEEITERVEVARGQEVFRLRGQLLPLVRLGEVLDSPEPFTQVDASRISAKFQQHHKDQETTFNQEKIEAVENNNNQTQNLLSLTFAVLKVGNFRYGLVIEQVLDTEEIVVKPMHSYLKNLQCYAGSTLMGDGKVAQILDVPGIAKHAGVSFDSRLDGKKGSELKKNDVDSHDVILFRYGLEEQFAIPIRMIKRIEHIQKEQIEFIGKNEYVTIDGRSTKVIRLDAHLDVSPYDEQDRPYLLLPTMVKKPFCFLISKVCDIVNLPMALDEEAYQEQGILGTTLVDDKMTLFIDTFSLIDKAEPGWMGLAENDDVEGRKTKILLLEDMVFFRNLVTGYLTSAGYDVVTAEDGKIGLELFKENEFDMIVSDIEMPEMDGVEFIMAVRNIFNNHSIPAMALTSLDSDADRNRALDAGFNAYEVKIDKENLLKKVLSLKESIGR